MNQAEKADAYEAVFERVEALLDGEDDWIAALATVSCELHESFPYFHWTGFYRHVRPSTLVIGPYQGSHGCLRTPFSRGVCGAAARTRATQLVPDVHAFPDHIACSSTTRSEIVVPILTAEERVLGVLDVDSDEPDAFDAVDQRYLEAICAMLAERFGEHDPL